MSAPVIRPFSEPDRPQLVALWERCELTRPWNDPNRDIDRKVAVGDDLLLVAEASLADPTVVGSVMVGYEGHRGWINYLAVDPSVRRSGLGTVLMNEARSRLTALGCPKINLQIRSSNLGAVAFYERVGYVTDDAISMGLRLIDDER